MTEFYRSFQRFMNQDYKFRYISIDGINPSYYVLLWSNILLQINTHKELFPYSLIHQVRKKTVVLILKRK